jgi:hypothetical protein
MDVKRLEEFCRNGEKADAFLREGRTRDALNTYETMTARLEHSGELDSYLIAKLTLGILRARVKLGDFKQAFAVWNAHLDEGVHGLGIYALESAQTTVHDMITYDMICAFLHTLADSDKTVASKAVTQYLSRVCEHAIDEGDRDLLKQSLSNWKHHLKELHGVTIPIEYARPLIAFEKTLEEAVKPQPIDFPLPTAWEKPKDFQEMSRVVQLKNLPKAKNRAG